MSNDKNIVTKTNDGYVVELFANCKPSDEIEEYAEGITILELDSKLDEESLYAQYIGIVEKLDERPIVVKVMEKDTDILKVQLRAMLRVAKLGDLSIIFPQIASAIELIEYKQLLEECKKELEKKEISYRKHIKVGTVVEIPSSALLSYEIGKECDFFFIDINSLMNYAFGVKQNNKKTTDKYVEFQPALIKLIQQAIQGAHDAGIYCGICGGMVENKLYMPLLIGLGLDQFSMDSSKILEMRNAINQLDKSECKYLVEEILKLRKIEDIEHKLKQFVQN